MITRSLVRTRAGHIHVRRAGKGPPLMLFHINQQSSAMMLELMEALGPNFDVLAMDYPSHGMSDHVTGQPTISDYADVAVEIMDALKIEQAFVVGEAVGALVAVDAAARHGDRVRGAILVNLPYLPGLALKDTKGDVTSDLRPSDESGFPLTRTIAFVLERDPEHAPLNPTQSWMDRINVAQVEAGRDRWQALDALRRYDLMQALKLVRCPTRVLMGEHFFCTAHLAALTQDLPGAEHRIIPGGRFCMTWEKAPEVAQEAVRFFAAG